MVQEFHDKYHQGFCTDAYLPLLCSCVLERGFENYEARAFRYLRDVAMQTGIFREHTGQCPIEAGAWAADMEARLWTAFLAHGLEDRGPTSSAASSSDVSMTGDVDSGSDEANATFGDDTSLVQHTGRRSLKRGGRRRRSPPTPPLRRAPGRGGRAALPSLGALHHRNS